MRRGLKTIEFHLTAVLMSAAYSFLPPPSKYIAICAIANSYVISRMLFKVRRGQFHRAWQTTEFGVYLLAQAALLAVWQVYWYLIVANHAIFLITRGKVKAQPNLPFVPR